MPLSHSLTGLHVTPSHLSNYPITSHLLKAFPHCPYIPSSSTQPLPRHIQAFTHPLPLLIVLHTHATPRPLLHTAHQLATPPLIPSPHHHTSHVTTHPLLYPASLSPSFLCLPPYQGNFLPPSLLRINPDLGASFQNWAKKMAHPPRP